MKIIQGKPQPFGAYVEGGKVNFAVQVPAGKKCEVLLYRAGKQQPRYRYEMPEEEGIGEVRFLAIEGIEAEKYEYNFLIGDEVYVDPYVKEIAGKRQFGKRQAASPERLMPAELAGMTEMSGLPPVQGRPDHEEKQDHQIRGKLVSAEYDWQGDKRLHIPWHEVIAYSLHVRGFTKHRSSKAAHKGTFQGVIEKIPYLKELGINQIQCMPVYEFDECAKDRINYWGYGPAYFFAPKESYAAGHSAVHELKDMVRECHKAGIEVVLEMPFTSDTAPQTALECLRFYMMEYHIDGFVVNPYTVPWDMLSNDPFLKDIKLIRKDDEFQNVMRRFLKGDENMVNDVIRELCRHSSVDGKCNYISAQTGFTLWDLVSYDGKHNEANGENNTDGPDYNFSWNCGAEGPSRKKAVLNLRKNQVKNAMLLLLTAQGTPCLLAGDEFYNSQHGNNNVYCQDNETAWVDWSRLKTDDPLFCFVKGLIAFRKKYPCLHRKEELQGLDRSACGMPDVSWHGEHAWRVQADVASRQLGVLYAGADTGTENCFIAYNMHWLPHSYALPSPGKDREWRLAGDTARGILDQPEELADQKSIELTFRSISVLVSAPCEKKDNGKKSRPQRKKITGKDGQGKK